MKRQGKEIHFLLLVFFLVFLPATALSQQARLTILHTNDTHGHLLPFSYPPILAAGSELAELDHRTNIGGIARRAALAKRLRKELGEKGTTVWLVDAGDITDGTPFSTEYHGEADVAAMNAAGYDFSTLGNHEFNLSLPGLKKLLGLFRYPVLCANVVEASGRPLTQEYEVKDLGLLKVGVFGLVTRGSAEYRAAREGLEISDEIGTSRRMAKELEKSADIIILLSHSGERVDRRIAAAVPEIDVIVGGHSHSRFPSGELVWHSDQLKPMEVNGTVIVQAHQWGGELGRLDLLFERNEKGVWHVGRYRARLIPVTSAIPEDPAVAAVVDRYWKPIAARYGEIIGEAAGDFVTKGDDLTPYNLVADAVRETYNTQIEFENLGGIRAELVKGKITMADLVAMDPFDNTIVTFRIKGSRLKKILVASRPAVSGIRYRIENKKLVQATVGGRRIEDDRSYTGATNSFFAASALKGIQIKDTGKPRLGVIVDYIRKKGVVKPAYDGRRVIIP